MIIIIDSHLLSQFIVKFYPCILESESESVDSGILIFGPSLSLAAVLVLVSTIFIIVLALLARSRAKALRELELSRQGRNVTYEEITLPPVAIDTSQNVAYGHVVGRY